jgi:hypothetical protein
VRIIPVLLPGSAMPDAAALPESLSWLPRCNEFELSDRLWADSTRVLADAVAVSVGGSSTVMRTSAAATRARVVYAGGIVDLTRPIATIGRRADNDIVLDDPEVSRVHAEIRMRGGGHAIVDRGSTNGIRVNGVRVDEQVLQFGDAIAIAGHQLRYEHD